MESLEIPLSTVTPESLNKGNDKGLIITGSGPKLLYDTCMIGISSKGSYSQCGPQPNQKRK